MSIITVIGDIENSLKKDTHKQYLFVADLLLNEYNKKSSSDLKVVYTSDNFSFKTSDSNNNFVPTLQYLSIMSAKTDSEKEHDVDYFTTSIVQANFQKVWDAIIVPRELGKLKNSDIEFFKILKYDFITIYKDFIYLSFLSDTQNKIIRERLNIFCDKLINITIR